METEYRRAWLRSMWNAITMTPEELNELREILVAYLDHQLGHFPPRRNFRIILGLQYEPSRETIRFVMRLGTHYLTRESSLRLPLLDSDPTPIWKVGLPKKALSVSVHGALIIDQMIQELTDGASCKKCRRVYPGRLSRDRGWCFACIHSEKGRTI